LKESKIILSDPIFFEHGALSRKNIKKNFCSATEKMMKNSQKRLKIAPSIGALQ
jgi:hypothetical protein